MGARPAPPNASSPRNRCRPWWYETADAILPKDDHREIEAVLKLLLTRDAVLCSDGGGKGPIALAARDMLVDYRAVNLRKGIRVLAGVYHIQQLLPTIRG